MGADAIGSARMRDGGRAGLKAWRVVRWVRVGSIAGAVRRSTLLVVAMRRIVVEEEARRKLVPAVTSAVVRRALWGMAGVVAVGTGVVVVRIARGGCMLSRLSGGSRRTTLWIVSLACSGGGW